MDAAGGTREESRKQKHQIQPEQGDEQADAGRDCRTRLARPNSQARTRTGEMFIFLVQLITSRIGNLTRLIHTLATCVTLHTCLVSPFSKGWWINREWAILFEVAEHIKRFFPCPCSQETGSAVPSCISPLILQTHKAESGDYYSRAPLIISTASIGESQPLPGPLFTILALVVLKKTKGFDWMRPAPPPNHPPPRKFQEFSPEDGFDRRNPARSSHLFWTSDYAFRLICERTGRGHTEFLIHLPSAALALTLYREKDSAVPFPRRP